MEEWRDIPGYEGFYKVSNQGRIMSIARNGTKGGLLNLHTNKFGYLMAQLWKNNSGKWFMVHRLVAMTFIPNDDIFKIEVNHKDECKTRNFVWVNEDGTIDPEKSNLEWVTKSYNVNYGSRNKKCSLKSSKPVKQLSLDGTLITIWPSITDVSKNGYDPSHVVKCCTGKINKHKGYKWAYA